MTMNINLSEILAIIAPLAALIAWVYSRLDKRFDRIEQKFDNTGVICDHSLKGLNP